MSDESRTDNKTEPPPAPVAGGDDESTAAHADRRAALAGWSLWAGITTPALLIVLTVWVAVADAKAFQLRGGIVIAALLTAAGSVLLIRDGVRGGVGSALWVAGTALAIILSVMRIHSDKRLPLMASQLCHTVISLHRLQLAALLLAATFVYVLRRGRPSVGGRAAVVAVSAPLLLSLAELFAPLYVPSAQHAYYHAHPEAIEYNSRGYRDHEWADTPTKPRLLFIGDSFTFGQGVEAGKRFTDLLAAERPEWEVCNAGGIARNMGDYTRAYELQLHRLKARRVVVVFFVNDLELREFPPPWAGPPWAQIYLDFFQACYLGDWFYWNVVYRAGAGGEGVFSRLYTPDRLAAFEGYLHRLKHAVERDGAALQMFLFPAMEDFSAYRYRRGHEMVLEICRRVGVPTIDLLPAFVEAGRSPRDLRVAPHDMHPNALGHEIAARAMSAHLRP